MIVHVAEAGEARGRVVLRCSFSPVANDTALKAAIHIAKAYHSEIEALFIENRHVLALADYDFVSEVSLAGGTPHPVEAAKLQSAYQAVYGAEGRHILAAGAAAGIESRVQTIRDDEISALHQCCAASGPWNVVVLAEALENPDRSLIGRVLETVQDATAVVAATRKSGFALGPIVIAVEDEDRLPVMLRTAERLAAVHGSDIRLLPVAESNDDLHWLEAQARLLIAGNTRCVIESNGASRHTSRAVAERVDALRASFVIARYGGLLLPHDGYSPLAASRCQVFSIR